MAPKKTPRNPYLPTFGRELARVRKALGLSQGELAERCLVEPNTVSQWEGGKNEPTDSNLAHLENATGVNLRPVLYGGQARDSEIPAYMPGTGPAPSAMHSLFARLERLSPGVVTSVCRIAEAAADELERRIE